MFTEDLSWDKQATHTEDTESFLPLSSLQALSDDGVIGSLNGRFFGVPTEYSQRRTGLDADQVPSGVNRMASTSRCSFHFDRCATRP